MCIDGKSSEPSRLECGVPQGSGLGPILFTLYASPLEDIILEHELDLMLFADDSQLYLVCERAVDSSFRVENCIKDIRSWMVENRLVLNDSKTEVMHIRSKFKKTTDLVTLRVGDSDVSTCSSVRDLGVIFSNRADMTVHISKI